MSFTLFNHFTLQPFSANNPLKGKVVEGGAPLLLPFPDLTVKPCFQETLPLSKEEVAHYSVLDRCPSFLTEIDPKNYFQSPEKFWLRLLANFLGGGLITGGEKERMYDGFNNIPNYKVWCSLLQSVYSSFDDQTSSEAKTLSNILTGLKKLEAYSEKLDIFSKIGVKMEGEIQSLAYNYAQLISQLKLDECQPLLGGWSNIGGKDAHAFIYDFIRREDGKFDIVIYSSTEFHLTELFLVGIKREIYPCTIYRGVPEYVILQNRDGKIRPAFIQMLIEHRAIKAADANADIEDKEILISFSLLNPYLERQVLNEQSFITGQRGGTCVLSVTKAWIRQHAYETDFYKQLMFRCMQQLMVAGYHAMKESLAHPNTFIGEDLRRGFIYFAKNMMRRAGKVLEEERKSGLLLSPEQSLQALATSQDLLQRIEKVEKEVEETKKEKNISYKVDSIDFSTQKVARQGQKRIERFEIKPSIKGNHSLPDLSIRFNLINPLPSLEATVKKCHSLNKNAVHYRETLFIQIHHLVDQLPIPEFQDDWNLLSVEIQMKCLKFLDEIVSLYSPHYWEDRQTRSIATCSILQATIHRLVVLMDKGKLPKACLQNYKVPFFGELSHQIQSLIYFNRLELQKTNRVIAYFKKINEVASEPPLFEIEARNKEVKKNEIEKSPGNTQFWNALLDDDPTLRTKVEERGEKKYPTLTVAKIEEEFAKELEEYKLRLNEWESKKDSRSRPSEPRRKVNLPSDTRNLMILEEFENDPLKDSGYEHVLIWRKMNFLFRDIFHGKQSPSSLCVFSYRQSSYSMTGDFYTSNPSLTSFSQEAASLFLLRDHRILSPECRTFLNYYSACHRNTVSWKRGLAEGTALKTPPQNPFLAKLLRVISERKLSPSQLIFEMEKEFHLLTDPSIQSLFFLLFFRSPIEKGEARLGAGDLLVGDQALLINCRRFIQNGLAHFERMEEGSSGARFFFEFAYYIEKYLPQRGEIKIADLDALNGWLLKENVSTHDRSAFHLYRLLFYSLHENSTFTSSEVGKIYESWMQTLLIPQNTQWRSPQADYDAVQFILSLTDQIKDRLKDPIFRNDVLNTLARGVIGVEESYWKLSAEGHPIYINEHGVTIELSAGRIHTSTGIFKGMARASDWEASPAFKRIFQGDNRFDYKVQGDWISFAHPRFGNFRLFQTLQGWNVECQFPQSKEWFQYSTETKGIPNILSYGHSYWVPITKRDDVVTGYLCRLDDHRPLFATTTNGDIVQVNPTNGLLIGNGLTVHYLDSPEKESMSGFTDFETEGNILLFTENTMIKEIQFPRYCSVEGNPLKFIQEGEDLVWVENRQLAFRSKKWVPSLGNFKQYLYLTSKSSKIADKILIPFIDLDPNPFEVSLPKKEQWGNELFFAYHVHQGELKPLTIEGKLFLAYLFFSQQKYPKYREAVRFIKEIQQIDLLSDLSLQILDYILKFGFKEDHPDGAMVKLFVALALIQNKEKISDQQPETYLNISHFNCAISSLQRAFRGMNNISSPLRLSSKDEIFLLTTLIRDGGHYNISPNTRLLIQNRLYQLSGKATEVLKIEVKERKLFEDKKIDSDTIWLKEKPTIPIQKLGENEKEFLNRMQSYEKELADFNKWMGEKKEWLTQGSTEFELYIRPDQRVPLDKNGWLVFKALQTVKRGSEDELRDLRIRLLLWFNHARGKTNDLCRAIQILFADPKSLPGEIDLATASDEEILKFLQQLVKSFWRAIKLNECWEQITDKVKPIQTKTPALGVPKKIFPKKEAETPLAPNLTFDPQQKRWEQLGAWKKDFLFVAENILPVSGDPFSATDALDHLLYSEEENFRDSLRSDLQKLEEEMAVGKRQNEERIYFDIEKEKCRALHHEVQHQLKELQQKKSSLEKEIIQKVNQRSVDPLQQIKEMARMGGDQQSLISIDDCIDCLLTYNVHAFQNKNPHLKDKEADELAHLTLALEDLKSQIGQWERISRLASEIEESENLPRMALCQKLAFELDGLYYFDSFSLEEQMIFRIFCGETQLIPYKKQIDFIKKMLKLDKTDPAKYRDFVGQLMYGEGKTSLIALLLLFLAARRPGRFAPFIVPSSLYPTVLRNLGPSMLRAFHCHILTFNFTRKDLTPYKLRQVMEIIQRTKNEHLPLIHTPSVLQILELEFLSVAREIKDLQKKLAGVKENLKQVDQNLQACEIELQKKQTPSQEALLKDQKHKLTNQKQFLAVKISFLEKSFQQLLEKLKLLHLIDFEYKNHADALIDELDTVFDCHQEVNFPGGETLKPDSTRNLLLYQIFQWMLSEELAHVIKLNQNKQGNMTLEEYRKKVIPYLAQQVAESFEPISSQLGEFKQAFISFVSEIQPRALQGNRDPFILHLKKLYETGREDHREFVNLVAETRLFFLYLLSETLKNAGNSGYGPRFNDPNKIVRYHAVGTPSKLEFGNHKEEMAYNYQWSAGYSVTEAQVAAFAQIAMEQAIYYVQTEGEKLEETAEFETFVKLFNVRPDKISRPGNLKEAAEYISKESKHKLEFQYEMVSLYVKYRSERLSSTGIDLIDQLSSCRAMSATPWIADALPPTLANRIKLDRGTEGRVLDMLIRREKEGKIHTVVFHTIQELMDQVFLHHPSPQNVRGIIEGGALFKIFKNNAAVAKDLMDYLAAKQEKGLVDSRIIGVLFFHFGPGQDQPTSLYIWRKGALHPDFIGASTKENLEAHDLDPSKYFVYFDEGNTIGQDIPKLPEAISLYTFDIKTGRSKFGQGLSRLRLILLSQRAEIVYTPETRKALFNEGKRAQDLVIASEKVQSIAKTRYTPRSFSKQIDSIPRSMSIQQIHLMVAQAIVGELPDDFGETVEKLEPFFVTKIRDEPFQQCGFLPSLSDTKKMLKGKLDAQLTLFKEQVKDANLIARADHKAKKLQLLIEKTDCLPKEWDDRTYEMKVDLEMEVHVDQLMEQETDYKMEEELELELSLYEQVEVAELEKDKPISMEEFLQILESFQNNSFHSKISSLQTILQQYPYGMDDKRIDYDKVFEEPLFGTSAFFHTCKGEKLLPIFHPLQKPAKQILAIKKNDNQMVWLCVSEHEGESIRKHLKKLYQENNPCVATAWLIQPNGSLFLKGEKHAEFPLYDEQVERGIFEINALLGHIDYLESHPDILETWLQKEPQIKIRFLKMKVGRDPKQNMILRRSHIIFDFDKESHHAQPKQMFRARAVRNKNREGKLKVTREELKLLPAKKVRFLHPNCVKLLGIDSSSDDLVMRQFEALAPHQVAHLVPEQMKWLPLEKVVCLEKPEQIFKSDQGGKYFLSVEQVQKLKSHQQHLIPYVNPEFYCLFTELWQINNVLPRHIDKIHPDLVPSLDNREQIANLAPAQIKFLNRPSQIECLTTSQVPHLDPTQVAMLPIDKVQFLDKPEQIQRLNREQAQNMKQHQAALIPHLDPDFYRDFNQLWQVESISLEHANKILTVWIPFLQNERLIASLNPDQISHLKTPQVKFLPLDKIKFLKKALQFEGLTPEQVRHLDPCQIPLLLPAQVRHVHVAHVKYLNKSTQISSLLDFQISGLIEAQADLIPYLSPTLLPRLTEIWQIQRIPKNSISCITKEQIKHLTPDQIPQLVPEQVKFVPCEKVNFLNKPEQIQALTCEQVPSLEPSKIPHLIPAQVPYLPKEKVQFVNNAAQISSLTLVQISGLVETQADLIPHLYPTLFSHLTEIWQIQRIPLNQIQCVLPQQMKHLTQQQKDALRVLRTPLRRNQLAFVGNKGQMPIDKLKSNDE